MYQIWHSWRAADRKVNASKNYINCNRQNKRSLTIHLLIMNWNSKSLKYSCENCPLFNIVCNCNGKYHRPYSLKDLKPNPVNIYGFVLWTTYNFSGISSHLMLLLWSRQSANRTDFTLTIPLHLFILTQCFLTFL